MPVKSSNEVKMFRNRRIAPNRTMNCFGVLPTINCPGGYPSRSSVTFTTYSS